MHMYRTKLTAGTNLDPDKKIPTGVTGSQNLALLRVSEINGYINWWTIQTRGAAIKTVFTKLLPLFLRYFFSDADYIFHVHTMYFD